MRSRLKTDAEQAGRAFEVPERGGTMALEVSSKGCFSSGAFWQLAQSGWGKTPQPIQHDRLFCKPKPAPSEPNRPRYFVRRIRSSLRCLWPT